MKMRSIKKVENLRRERFTKFSMPGRVQKRNEQTERHFRLSWEERSYSGHEEGQISGKGKKRGVQTDG